MLFIGPTGCGKTFLVELLFVDILKLPTVIVDMTSYSETGYVGQDVGSILTRLVYAADLNPVTASIGIVCLDEFDKLASGKNNAVFAGAGTTKDVSGLGVQRELLKILLQMELNEEDEVFLFDVCVKVWEKINKKPSVRLTALKFMVEIAKKYPEYPVNPV